MPKQPLSLKENLFIASQYLIPRVLLTRAMGYLGYSTCPWIKNTFISWFHRHFKVDLSEAQCQNPRDYESFNAFFTRALKPEARPIVPDPNVLLSPCDGTLLSQGHIASGDAHPLSKTAIKGHQFTLCSLLAEQSHLVETFKNGHMSIIYLAPKDYHRVHMPVAGRLLSMTHVPGTLFSVNDVTVRNVPGVFARNERLICTFDTDRGQVCVILVGALIVGSIATSWAGIVSPRSRAIAHTDYAGLSQAHTEQHFAQGQEMGRFLMGSTVIILTETPHIQWNEQVEAKSTVRMGQPLATWCS